MAKNVYHDMYSSIGLVIDDQMKLPDVYVNSCIATSIRIPSSSVYLTWRLTEEKFEQAAVARSYSHGLA